MGQLGIWLILPYMGMMVSFIAFLGIGAVIYQIWKNRRRENHDTDSPYMTERPRIWNPFFIMILALLGSMVLICLIVLGNDMIRRLVIVALMALIFIGTPCFLLGKFIIHKRVKGTNRSIYGTITNVEAHSYEEYDPELRRHITRTIYYITYEYSVDGMYYTGSGHKEKIFAPKAGQRIRIYYNEYEPETSETASNRNQYLYICIFITSIFVITGLLLRLA